MRRLAAMLALTFILPLAPLAAPNAEAAFSVVSDETTSRFPTALDFRLHVRSEQPINEIQINMAIGREQVSSYGRPTFQPSTDVTAEYTLRTGADKYIPPMAQITYWYQIKDASGAQLETEKRTIRYDDPKYRWQQLQRDKLIVYFHDQSAQRVERILSAGLATIADAKSSFGVDVTNPIALVVYNTRDEMNAALPAQSQTAQEQLITLGQAHAEYDVVLVLDYQSNDRELIETTRHELQHVITSQATYNPYSQLPLWLNEGLSVYVQGTGQETYVNYVTRAQRGGRVFYFRELAGRPGRPDETLQLYGQGYLMVKYLHDKYGADSIKKLFDAYKQGKSTDEAFTIAFGKPLDAIDTDWRATLGLPPVPERSTPLGGNTQPAIPTVVPLGAAPASGVPTVAPNPPPAAAAPTQPATPSQAIPGSTGTNSSILAIAGAVVLVLVLATAAAMVIKRRS